MGERLPIYIYNLADKTEHFMVAIYIHLHASFTKKKYSSYNAREI